MVTIRPVFDLKNRGNTTNILKRRFLAKTVVFVSFCDVKETECCNIYGTLSKRQKMARNLSPFKVNFTFALFHTSGATSRASY